MGRIVFNWVLLANRSTSRSIRWLVCRRHFSKATAKLGEPLASASPKIPLIIERDCSDSSDVARNVVWANGERTERRSLGWVPWLQSRTCAVSSPSKVARRDGAHTLVSDIYCGAKKVLTRIYLPENYPDSVKPGYARYSTWVFLQSAAGSASYVLSTNALLCAVGVAGSGSSAAATGALSAAIAWTLKDGLGCLGVIAYSSRFGSRFDQDTKRFRIRGDIAHNLGVALELLTALAGPAMFVPLASAANALKGVAGVVGGATRAAINRCWAAQSNLGDVTARLHSISLTAYLLGMSVGIGAHRVAVESAPAWLGGSDGVAWLFFGAFASIHLGASFAAMRCVQLTTLSPSRLALVTHDYWTVASQPQHGGPSSSGPPTLLDPAPANRQEAIVGRPTADVLFQPPVRWGASIEQAFPETLHEGSNANQSTDSAVLLVRSAVDLFAHDRCLVWPTDGVVWVLVHPDAQAGDFLKAALLSSLVSLRLAEQSEHYRSPADLIAFMDRLVAQVNGTDWPRFNAALKHSSWENDQVLLSMGPIRCKWNK